VLTMASQRRPDSCWADAALSPVSRTLTATKLFNLARDQGYVVVHPALTGVRPAIHR
jgi:hypothetical protein